MYKWVPMNEMLFVLDTSPTLDGLALDPMGAGRGGGEERLLVPSCYGGWR